MESFEATLFLDKAESTRKAYLGNLRRLNNGKEIKNVNFLKDTKKNLEYVDKVDNPSTKKNYFISSVAILEGNKKMKKYYDIYHEQMLNLNKKLTAEPFKSEATLEKVAIPMEKLLQRQKELYDQIDFKWKKSEISKANLELLQDTLITSLYTLMPPRRNDYTEVKIEEPKEDKFNYYDKYKFYFNTFKTAKHYGQQITDVPDEIGRLIELRQRLSPNEWLLTNQKGHKLSTSMMSKAVSKAFGFDVGSSAIRNIFATHNFGGQKAEMKQVATDMGTSVAMLSNIYIND
jgi:hypothetical protein